MVQRPSSNSLDSVPDYQTLEPFQGSHAEEEGDEELGAEDLGDEEEEQVHTELPTIDETLMTTLNY